LELTNCNFQKVVNRLEAKGDNEAKQIERLKVMKELRIKSGMPYKDFLD